METWKIIVTHMKHHRSRSLIKLSRITRNIANVDILSGSFLTSTDDFTGVRVEFALFESIKIVAHKRAR